MKNRTALDAAAGAAAPALPLTVQAPAQATEPAPPIVQAPARDAYTGIGGNYLRDAATGIRTRIDPAPQP